MRRILLMVIRNILFVPVYWYKLCYHARHVEKYTEEEISERAEEVCEEFFKRLPYVQQMLLKDVQAGFDGDPAAKSREDVVISYPGLFAIYVYRLAHLESLMSCIHRMCHSFLEL